jgi:tetratricopeptide (TPR) repeat protein
MGEVYAAHDPDLDREVALKLVWGKDLDSQLSVGERKRLLREAQALARLSHPNVVVVHDAGEFQGGVFIAMEFVDGPTLRKWNSKETRSWQEIRDVFVAAGQGLLAAHEAGMVHRDFKPDNVMLDGQGNVRVLDFGLAREDGAILSTGDHRQGTPGYVAPDQHMIASADARGDVFAFCVAFYEMLYGERPFRPDGENMLQSVISGKTQTASLRTDVPRWLRRTLSKGLSPVDQRWGSMQEVLDALQYDRSQRRRRRTVLGAFALVAAGVAGFALSKTSPECASWSEEVSAIWGEQSAAEFRARVDAVGLEVADVALDNTIASIDGYATSLREALDATCEEASTDVDAALLALRRACLDEHRARLEVTVDNLMRQPATAVKHPERALKQLVPLSRCEEAQRRLAYRETVADPRIADLRERRLALAVALATGVDDDTVMQMKSLLAEAESSGSDAALVEVRSMLGEAMTERGQFAEAQRYFESALSVALRTADPDLQWRPIYGLLFLHAQAGRLEEIKALLPVGRAIVDAAGESVATHRVQLSNLEGLAYMRAGDLERARSTFAALDGADSRAEGEGILNNLGATYYLLGRLEEAEQTYRRAFAGYAEKYGPENARSAEIQVNLADVMASQGKFGPAIELYGKSLQTYEHIGLGGSAEYARALHHRGDALFRTGKLVEGGAAIDEAIRLLQSTAGAEHPYTVVARHSKALLLLAEGNVEGAREISKEDGRAFESFAISGPTRAILEAYRGRVALLSGDEAGAVRHYETCLETMADSSAHSPAVAECHAGLLEVELRRGDIQAAVERLPAARVALDECPDFVDPGSTSLLQTWIAAALAVQGRLDEARAAATAAAARTAGNPGDPLVPSDLQRRLIDDPEAAAEELRSAKDAGTAG